MRFKIFPAIGFARLGQDEDFFVGSEVPNSGPTELGGAPVARFKNAAGNRIRKQAARFRLFQSEDGSSWQPAQLAGGATIRWQVTLANKKAAVTRPADPPIAPMRPVVPAANRPMVIAGGSQSISGSNAVSSAFSGTFTTTTEGLPFSTQVVLGQLRTDADGNLLVLGGSGISGAPPGVTLGDSFYVNPNWYDDVADGPVNATIQLADGSPPQNAEGGAWVIVAPPDYAPTISGVVTLYDVIRQVGIDNFGVPAPTVTSYDLDIAPLIWRTRTLHWVHENARWADPRLVSANLRSTLPADHALRKGVHDLVVGIGKILRGHVDPQGPSWKLRDFQTAHLDAWANGNFDATAVTPPAGLSADGLTRAALECAVGQGFCPGIEAGIIVLDPTLYVKPFDFRIDQTSAEAGDLTALMAQPWQADFHQCAQDWWPTQRPDIAFQPDGTKGDWERGIHGPVDLVNHASQLGFIVRDGAFDSFIEAERDPLFPP